MSSIVRWITLTVVVLLTLLGCGAQPEHTVHSGNTMGTYYRISLACKPPGSIDFEAELGSVNQEMSNYDPASTLSQLNRAPLGEWHTIEPALHSVLHYAQGVHKTSEGAFDITIAPVLSLWGFGPDARNLEAAPTAQALQQAAALVAMSALELRPDPPAARRMADITLDLSALAKGHGVDRIAQLLDDARCEDYLIDIGGEVRARGSAERNRPWRIGVEVPDAERMGAIQRVVRLQDQAIATSGDYRNFIELPAEADSDPTRRWSHSIDPRTARPVAHGLASVSVIADLAMQADAWATALTVLGPDQGLALAQRQNMAALFVVRSEAGFEERYTAAFQANLEQAPR
ncbi:MAG: FAD:protein FMN transferase [Pseudomonadales bacterium]